jgi:predicted nicotinamide N-methyase
MDSCEVGVAKNEGVLMDSEDIGELTNEIRWIESESLFVTSTKHEAEDMDLGGLFTDPDPFETFSMEWKLVDFSEPARITVTGIKAENGQTIHSTGLTLWRASNILADFLVSIHNERAVSPPFQVFGATVLELGAGLGIPSLLCHFYLGASLVVVTDGDVDTLQNLRLNIAAQELMASTGNLICQQLVWGNEGSIQWIRKIPPTANATSPGLFNIILGSDIIYVDSVVEPLFDTVRLLLQVPNGVFVLAFARRNVSIDFVLRVASKKGFVYDRPTDMSIEGIYLFRLPNEAVV